MRKIFIILILLIGFLIAEAENSIRIVSYNVENLFHTPDSTKHWTHTKYWNKIEKISRVISNIGEWKIPAIVGLQEVENDSCMIDLCRRMKNYHYSYIHYDSQDKRGIDVAMLYDSTQYKVIYSQPINIILDSITTTRDILYTKGILKNGDTLYVMVCHLPSQLGGKAESQWKRDIVLNIIEEKKKELKDKNLIIMGDFNGGEGNMYTHKFQGKWAQLDYIWVSDTLTKKASVHVYDAPWLMEYDKKYLGYKPKRTYNGYKYNKDGYSDHLPIYLDLTCD